MNIYFEYLRLVYKCSIITASPLLLVMKTLNNIYYGGKFIRFTNDNLIMYSIA